MGSVDIYTIPIVIFGTASNGRDMGIRGQTPDVQLRADEYKYLEIFSVDTESFPLVGRAYSSCFPLGKASEASRWAFTLTIEPNQEELDRGASPLTIAALLPAQDMLELRGHYSKILQLLRDMKVDRNHPNTEPLTLSVIERSPVSPVNFLIAGHRSQRRVALAIPQNVSAEEEVVRLFEAVSWFEAGPVSFRSRPYWPGNLPKPRLVVYHSEDPAEEVQSLEDLYLHIDGSGLLHWQNETFELSDVVFHEIFGRLSADVLRSLFALPGGVFGSEAALASLIILLMGEDIGIVEREQIGEFIVEGFNAPATDMTADETQLFQAIVQLEQAILFLLDQSRGRSEQETLAPLVDAAFAKPLHSNSGLFEQMQNVIARYAAATGIWMDIKPPTAKRLLLCLIDGDDLSEWGFRISQGRAETIEMAICLLRERADIPNSYRMLLAIWEISAGAPEERVPWRSQVENLLVDMSDAGATDGAVGRDIALGVQQQIGDAGWLSALRSLLRLLRRARRGPKADNRDLQKKRSGHKLSDRNIRGDES